jgi:hypothetical protein
METVAGSTRARVMQGHVGMWADNSQRDRIFEMIGCHSVTFHRVRNARSEHHRRNLILVLVSAALAWIALGIR